MTHRLLLLAILAILLSGAGCGGEPAPTPNIPIGADPSTATPPTAAQSSPTAAPPADTVEPPPTDTPAQTFAASTTETPQPKATQPPPTPSPPESSREDVASIRQIVYNYWEATNAYDVDLMLTMLEDGYRAQEEESIRSDIGRMKLFRVKLEVS